MVCKYGMRCFKVSRGDHCDSRDRAGGLPLERFIQVSTLAGQLKFAPIGGAVGIGTLVAVGWSH